MPPTQSQRGWPPLLHACWWCRAHSPGPVTPQRPSLPPYPWIWQPMAVSASCTRGPWQGLAESEVTRRWPLEWSVWHTAPETLDLDGRETLKALYARVADAFDDLVRSSDAATVVVFTHDAVVRAAVAWTLRVGPATYRHIDVANWSITTIHASTSGPRLVALNDTSHLRGSER
jgi:broad specificity phosphatase PhoE